MYLWIKPFWMNSRYTLSYIDGSFVLLVVQASQDKAIGVSKWCCLFCWELVTILANREDVAIYVRNCHYNVYAVDLPAWLPVEILNEMVAQFQKHLRAALVTMMRMPVNLEQVGSGTHRRTFSAETTSVWSITSGETSEHHPSLDSPLEEPA
jgi:hypothetical protein